MIQDRNDLPQFLSGVGVEIGVDKGDFSLRLLRDSHLSILYSIDPWKPCPCFPTPELVEETYRIACSKLRPFGKRSCVLRELGQQAATRFPLHSVDFVYIDSSHEYDETLEELYAWWPTLKPNGLFAGHDYCNGPHVRLAVQSFAARHELQIETTVRDADWKEYPVNSWMIRKPS